MSTRRSSVLICTLVIASTLATACAAPTAEPEMVEVTREVTKIVEGTPERVVEIVTATPEPVQEDAAELPEKIVVGALYPFTGHYAHYGEESQLAMQIAVDHINEEGGIQALGGIPLELVAEDCGESADTAKLAAEAMISRHDPVAIVGLFISRLTVAASEVTEREKVILIAEALVDDVTQQGRRYLFRPSPRAGINGATTVEFALDAAQEAGVPLDTIAILNENSSFGRSVGTGAVQAALDNGLTIVYHKEYPYDATDVSSIVGQIGTERPDLVVHSPYFTDAVLFAKTFDEMGVIPPFIAGAGGAGYTDAASIEALGDLANYYTNAFSYNPAKDTPWNNRFLDEFVAEAQHMPSEAGGSNYYCVWILKEALELAAEMFPDDPLNPDNLREAFLQLDLTSGPAVETYPSDRIQFDATGENIHAKAAVIQALDGEAKVVWPREDAEADLVYPRPDSTYAP